MTQFKQKASIWGIGLAMFSMFFGAGNIVFPLALGQLTQDKNLYAVFGMIITAVLVPLSGLLSMMLFEGDYPAFFRRIGKIPGILVTWLILIIIGPFGAARCVTISFSTLSAFGLQNIFGMNLLTFSLLSAGIIFLFSYRPNKILSLLGYVLTPVLLISLGIIVIKGLLVMPHLEQHISNKWIPFSRGLLEGYNTLDLLASFFFASMVLLCLKKDQSQQESLTLKENRRLLYVAILGGFIAALFLAVVYVSFSYLAAGFSSSLVDTPRQEMLGALTYRLLGPYAGLIVGIAVSFACLTTEIALAALFAQFLQKTLFKEKISYHKALAISLILIFSVSMFHFEGISSLLIPLIQISYPALIVLAVVNLLHKLYGFRFVKLPVYLAFVITLICYFY